MKIFFFKFESVEKNILVFELKEPIFFKLNSETIIEVICVLNLKKPLFFASLSSVLKQ